MPRLPYQAFGRSSSSLGPTVPASSFESRIRLYAGSCSSPSSVIAHSPAGRRLSAVAGTLDGFVLSELDLKERREGDVLGRNQSGRAITLRLLSLADHLVFIEAAREFCTRAYQDPGQHPGLASLAAQFTNTDRIEYLDKS